MLRYPGTMNSDSGPKDSCSLDSLNGSDTVLLAPSRQPVSSGGHESCSDDVRVDTRNEVSAGGIAANTTASSTATGPPHSVELSVTLNEPPAAREGLDPSVEGSAVEAVAELPSPEVCITNVDELQLPELLCSTVPSSGPLVIDSATTTGQTILPKNGRPHGSDPGLKVASHDGHGRMWARYGSIRTVGRNWAELYTWLHISWVWCPSRASAPCPSVVL